MALLSVLEIAGLGDSQKPAFNVPSRPAIMAFASTYSAAAAKTKLVQPCMLAAIVVRESGGQNILQEGMPPGDGCGVGLTQITSGVDWSVPSTPKYPNYGPLLDPATNLIVCAEAFLEPLLEEFDSNRLAAFAAYNAGPGAVQSALGEGESPDSRTTGHDYGAFVFETWINFTAASLGHNVDWASYQMKG